MSSQFQSLMNEFNILISKYQDTYQKYINAINSDNNSLKILDNFSFYGKNQIATLSNTNTSNCQSACLTNPSCSGATFNTLTNNCIISSGSGNIIPTQNSKAIIKESIYYSYELHNLNNKLIDINKKIMNNYNDNYQKYTTNSQSQQQENIMTSNYQILKEERSQIEKMIGEFETLHRAYENGNINVSANYYSYILLVIVVILLLILLLNFSFVTNQSGGSNMLHKMHIYKYLPYFLLLLLVLFIYSGYNL